MDVCTALDWPFFPDFSPGHPGACQRVPVLDVSMTGDGVFCAFTCFLFALLCFFSMHLPDGLRLMYLKPLFPALFLSLACPSAWSAPDFKVHEDSLPKALLQQVRATGLCVEGGPEIPSFQWRLELRRPLRKAREVQEHYAGSAGSQTPGLSPTLRYDLPGTSDLPSTAVSLRGLVRVSPEDKQIGARAEGLSFPLFAGKSFRIFFKDSGIDLGQQCTVADKVAASQLHVRLEGEASRIQCEGQGRYKGFEVKMHSTVYFIESLGVFLNVLDLVDSPLGLLKSQTRIVDLRMGQ